MNKISILLTEDHQLLRETLAEILREDDRFELVALSDTGEEAIELAKQFRPDIVLMDINLRGQMNGIEATRQVRAVSPGSRIIALSMHTQASYVYRMMESGASGYLSKNASLDEVLQAIVEVYNNRPYFSTGIDPANPGTNAMAVSKRQVEIIEFIRQGFSSREIADQLKVSVKTVEAHRYKVLRKLNLRNVAALVDYACTHRIIYN